MNYVVLDMEWNQAITYSDMIKEPGFLTGEIIQIGAIMLNDEFKAIGSFNSRVLPQYIRSFILKLLKSQSWSSVIFVKESRLPMCFLLFVTGADLTLSF